MMKKTSKKSFDTLGIVADLNVPENLHLLKQFATKTGDKQLCNFIAIAEVLRNRFVIAAGRFDGKGLFAALCDDENQLATAFRVANARMNEIGSRTTAWTFLPESCRNLVANSANHRIHNKGKNECPDD